MLNFKANRLIRKPYEVAYYGKKQFNKRLDSVSQAKIQNPFSPIFSPFPVAMDIIRSIQNRKKYASRASNFIKSILFIYKLVTASKLHLYTLFITTPNCTCDNHYHVIDKRNCERNPFTNYHKVMRNLRQSWQRKNPYLHDLISSIEATFGYRLAINVHLHGLLGSTRTLTASDRQRIRIRASRQASRSMNNEAVTVHIKPFKDKAGDRIHSVTAFVHYCLKQYRLPICKDMDDYKKFIARPARERHILVTSLLNSTRGLRCLSHVISSSSRFIKSLLIVHRTIQPSLFAVNTTSQVQSAPQNSHHYTSKEQWQRAETIQRSKRILKLGQKSLAKALFNIQYIILNEVNKNATNEYSDGQYIQLLSNIFKVTGIPP